jgi:glycosyltransferase involved in cell wall biosynthesis
VGELVVGMGLLTQGADQFTGTATYVRELLRELGQRTGQTRVEVLCNEHALTNFGSCASPAVRLTHASGHRVGTSRSTRALALARTRVVSRRLARQFTPDVRVVHYPLTLGVPPVRLPTVLSLHDVQHHDLPQHFSTAARLWRRIYYDGPARRATLVHTLSRYSKGRIVDRLGVDPHRVVVIPLAVDHRRFRPEAGARDAELLAPLCLPKRFLFYPATLWRHKNHLKLLDALALVEDDELHLVLCGGSFGRLPEILAAAARRGLADRVHHLGFIPDGALPAVYRRATAVVFPSTYEGFGAPPLEAMASGCPVASTLVGPLAEVCGAAAIELLPDDDRQMAEAIDRVASDEQLRAHLRGAGLEQAGRFSWVRVADTHLDAYRRASES